MHHGWGRTAYVGRTVSLPPVTSKGVTFFAILSTLSNRRTLPHKGILCFLLDKYIDMIYLILCTTQLYIDNQGLMPRKLHSKGWFFLSSVIHIFNLHKIAIMLICRYMKNIKNNNSGDLAIKGSSKMSNFCKETAYGIANFYNEEMYPLTTVELKPFIKQITKEFKNIFKNK